VNSFYELTQKYAMELFEYKEGNLYWKVRLAKRIKIGDIVGHKPNDGGTLRVFIKGKGYQVPHIIFLIEYGYLPKYIHYKDNNPLNLKIENLIEADSSEIRCVRKKPKHNKSGYKGVHFDISNNKYVALIRKNKKLYFLGKFNCPLEAYKKYCNMSKFLHGKFSKVT